MDLLIIFDNIIVFPVGDFHRCIIESYKERGRILQSFNIGGRKCCQGLKGKDSRKTLEYNRRFEYSLQGKLDATGSERNS